MESSRTHFEVLGLECQVFGLEASKSSKMSCLRPRTALLFDLLKTGQGHDHFFSLSWSTPETSRVIYENLFLFLENAGISRKICDIFARRPLFFWRTLARCVFGLDRVCPQKVGPWPRIFLCPWPRELRPRLHLWQKHDYTSRINGLCER